MERRALFSEGSRGFPTPSFAYFRFSVRKMAVEKAGLLLSREHGHVEEDEEEEEETKKLSKDRREGDQELSRM